MVLVKLITGSSNEREYYCNGLLKAKITPRAEMEIHLSFFFTSLTRMLIRWEPPNTQTVDDVNRNL